MKTHYTRFLPIAALAIAGAVQAQTPAASSRPPPTDTTKIDFVTVDRDANGVLSKEEAKAVADLNNSFAALDADHDDVVTPTEFTRWKRAGKIVGAKPPDPATAPSGSAGAQHMPTPN